MKKIISLSLVLVLIFSLTACSKKAPVNQNIELTIWEQMPNDSGQNFDEIAAKFMEANPNITVTRTHYETEQLRTNFQSAALAGEGPDLVYGPSDNVGIFTASTLIQPITNVVSEDFLKKFAPNALSDGKVDGEYWELPDVVGNQIAMLYNKDMIKEAPKTWNDLVKVASKYQDPANGKYGFLYNEKEPFWFVAWFGAYGGQVFDEKRNPMLDSDAMVKALQFTSDIRSKYKLGEVDMNYDMADAMFKDGNAAIILNGAWSWSSYKDAGINLGIAPLPTVPGGTNGMPFSSTKGYMISKFMPEEKKEALNKFFEFFLSSENDAKIALQKAEAPTNLKARELDSVKNDELQKSSLATIDYTTPMPIIPEMRAIWDAIRPELEAVISGDTTPKDAAKEMQKKAIDGINTIKGE
ncbi:maltose ABC transporter substrate-binding protein [Helicovermis profundi]|uniref:Maltodextrin-binding protein n=1 Tax=Helicovermis profundi TaxID=3065157 RepID=A0AAU9E3Q3_9FIRM|nr:maltose/maltodextrin ABC transporter substrate-binding protein MalE [Clostridia bacterium S502]